MKLVERVCVRSRAVFDISKLNLLNIVVLKANTALF